MSDVRRYPKLRAIESVIVQDPNRGRMILLRDTEGIAPSPVLLPVSLLAVLSRFDGTRTAAQIAESASKASRGAREAEPARAREAERVTEEIVRMLASELDDAFMLDTPRFRDRKKEVVRAFAEAGVREAAHAGGAYHDDASALRRFIEVECLAKAGGAGGARGDLVGLCAPHMDLWRAAEGYGHAYRALAARSLDDVDTFVLLGTSHAPMRRPFALCEKTFETPLGALEPDREMCLELASASRFDVRAEEYLHKQEHSLEFQAVFVRYLLGDRRARIVPVLCGLGEAQERRIDPVRDADAESFLGALAEACARRARRVVVIAGADMAHVGPRFGDAAPLDEPAREALAARDAESIARAVGMDARGFFDHVTEDLAARRVCGLGPIYTMLRAIQAMAGGERARGEVLHYAQHVDPMEGSIVSHTSLGFYAGA